MGGKVYSVYIMATYKNGTIYVGVTSDLIGRAYTHRNDVIDGFTRRYGLHSLVFCEHHDSVEAAIAREKQIKKWRRAWKIELIEKDNPHWLDLYDSLTGAGPEIVDNGFPLSRE